MVVQGVDLMDMQTMKHIDRFAGNPLCGALRLYDVVRHGRTTGFSDAIDAEALDTAREGEGGPKIAVIKFWGMGSLILASPLFSAVRQARPSARIHLITLSQNRDVVDLLDIADSVHYLDLSGSAPAVASKIIAFLEKIKRLELDAVIDLEYLTRFSAIVSYLSGAPARVGFHSWDVWRGNLHTAARAFNPYWHVTDNFMNLHRALGAEDVEAEPTKIKLRGVEDREAGELLSSSGVADDDLVIAVNANASTMALARRWPEDSFVELINRIVDAAAGRVVLLGSPEEAPFVEGLRKKVRHPDQVKSLAGKSTLRGLVGVLRRAALLVTNDSGPLHLASALGTRTVSFFGPETPVLFGPRGDGHISLYCGIDCSPCISIYNAKTVRCMREEPECLSKISVDDAFDAVKRALGD
jgi:ADP-heptose:LPS heptosyltransferase